MSAVTERMMQSGGPGSRTLRHVARLVLLVRANKVLDVLAVRQRKCARRQQDSRRLLLNRPNVQLSQFVRSTVAKGAPVLSSLTGDFLGSPPSAGSASATRSRETSWQSGGLIGERVCVHDTAKTCHSRINSSRYPIPRRRTCQTTTACDGRRMMCRCRGAYRQPVHDRVDLVPWSTPIVTAIARRSAAGCR